MYNRVRILVSGFVLSVLTILFLYYFSKTEVTMEGGFTRYYLSAELTKEFAYSFPYSSYYLAGVTTNYLYIGSVKRPGGLLALEFNTGDTTYHPIVTTTAVPRDAHFQIDSPNFYIQQQRLSTLLKGNLRTYSVIDTLLHGIFFVDVLVAGQHTLIFRTLSNTADEFVLASLQDSLLFHPSLLEKQLDGKFCTDGLLRSNPSRDHILYAYYYRNQFMCLDTAMNVRYRGNTIDTISRAQIAVASIPSSQSITLSTPPRIVNKNLQVGVNHFYIHSMIVSDNEVPDDLENYSNIDVYHLRDGSYGYSLRIPYLFGKELKDFRVHDNHLIVAYSGSVVVYKLPTYPAKGF